MSGYALQGSLYIVSFPHCFPAGDGNMFSIKLFCYPGIGPFTTGIHLIYPSALQQLQKDLWNISCEPCFVRQIQVPFCIHMEGSLWLHILGIRSVSDHGGRNAPIGCRVVLIGYMFESTGKKTLFTFDCNLL